MDKKDAKLQQSLKNINSNLSKKEKILQLTLDLFMTLIGTFIYAFAIRVFTAPNSIAPGGMTGIMTLVNHLSNFPIGLGVLLINIPLFFLAFKVKTKRYVINTIVSVVSFSVFADYILIYVPEYQGEKLLASLFGGVLMGLGMAIVFTRYSSTGGIDIIAHVINVKFPHFKIGMIILAIDAVIVIASIVVYGSLEPAMYAIIAIFTSTKVIDTIVYGLDKGKLVIIVTKNDREIVQDIISKLIKGVTIVKAQGGYSKQDSTMLFCAVRTNQFHKVKYLVNAIDPTAFIIVADASEVLGKGFKGLST